METMAARFSISIETKQLHRHNGVTKERRQVLHWTHEGYGRFTVSQLIGHNLRNRQRLDRSVQSLLQTFSEFNTRTNTFKHQLFVLTIVHALQVSNVARNAQRRHLLRKRRRSRTVSCKTHTHRNELLRKGFVWALS